MDALFDQFLADPLMQLGTRQLLQWGMRQFYAFTLVLVRMSGLMIVGPVFGTPVVPRNVRILLVVVMSLVITPTLGDRDRLTFERIDADDNGRLVRSEVPDNLRDEFQSMLARHNKPSGAALTIDEFDNRIRVPRTLVDYAMVAAGELSVGIVLGLGVLTILSALQLTGHIVDQQSGIALSQVANPGFQVSGSVSGQMLYVLGLAVFLLLEPLGGHLMMLDALVETFQTLPVGRAYVSTSVAGLLTDLVHQSLVLAFQIAAPVLAVMSLVALSMGYLGRTVPQINILVVGFPIRTSLNLLILALSLSGASRVLVDAVPGAIAQIREFLLAL